MSAMASQITGVSIVCSTVCSGANQRKHQSSASLVFVRETTGDTRLLRRVSNAENVFIWWRHNQQSRYDFKRNYDAISRYIPIGKKLNMYSFLA